MPIYLHAADQPWVMRLDKGRRLLGWRDEGNFTMQSNTELHCIFETLLFKDDSDPLKFVYPADHELAGQFEEQMTALEREIHGQW